MLAGLTRGSLADMGKLDPDDPRAPYLQIADDLRTAVESGALPPGAQLPSLPTLASEYDVSLGTAKSALTVLRDAGLIVTRPGKGSYVRTQTCDADDGKTPADFEDLRRFVERLAKRLDAVERRLADRVSG